MLSTSIQAQVGFVQDSNKTKNLRLAAYTACEDVMIDPADKPVL